MSTAELLKNRSEFEEKIRKLLARPVLLTQLNIFAMPCGCSGITAVIRGLEVDDLEVFEAQLLPILKETAENLDVKPSVTFAMVVPGSSIVASVTWKTLCNKCYPVFANLHGKTPRPDLYLLQFEKRK